MSAVARRYARAAVEAAAEQGGDARVEALVDGLRLFCRVLQESQELKELLLNPALHDQQEAVLTALLAKLSLSFEAAGLLRLVADRRRVDLLDDLLLQVEAIADERAGRVRAYVTSAIPLTEAQVARIQAALTKRLREQVVVAVDVDPELLGGLVCRVGDLTLDTSVRRELSRLRVELMRPSH